MYGSESLSNMGSKNIVEASVKKGNADTNTAEILHASRSWTDGKWKDHAMQWMAPITTPMQMAITPERGT